MKEYRSLLAILSALLIGGPSAIAVTYVDTDVINQFLDVSSPSYLGNFDIVNGDADGFDTPGYDPNNGGLYSATAAFSLNNPSVDGGNPDIVTLDLGIINLGTTLNIGFTTLNVSGQALINLSQTGSINYQVLWESGDGFILSWASLSAKALTYPGNNGVPDGGMTAGLLGLSLLVLVCLPRRWLVWRSA